MTVIPAEPPGPALYMPRLYCTTRHGHYVDAMIFRDRLDMLDYLRATGYDPDPDLRAMFGSFDRFNRAGHRTKHIGTMYFYLDGIGSGTVAHECAHAAFSWVWRRHATMTESGDGATVDNGESWIPASHPEERCCQVIGSLVGQFWETWYAAITDAWSTRVDKGGQSE